MAVFLINICKFNGCGITFPSLGDLIQHIEDTHIDYDPKVVEQKEQAQPACLPLSYVLRFISDDARKESPFLSANAAGVELKRKLAIKHHSYSMSSSNRSNTPTGSEMDEDEMVVSESEDSNDSWTTEEFSSEFIMRYGSRHSGTGSNGTPGNEKPFACPVPGCKKRYKNVNGIKYHSKNGHKKDGKVRKGYKCHCGKSYKTAQGLKSHALAAHNSSPESVLTTQHVAAASNSSGGILIQRSSSPSQSLGSLSPSSISNMSSSASSCHGSNGTQHCNGSSNSVLQQLTNGVVGGGSVCGNSCLTATSNNGVGISLQQQSQQQQQPSAHQQFNATANTSSNNNQQQLQQPHGNIAVAATAAVPSAAASGNNNNLVRSTIGLVSSIKANNAAAAVAATTKTAAATNLLAANAAASKILKLATNAAAAAAVVAAANANNVVDIAQQHKLQQVTEHKQQQQQQQLCKQQSQSHQHQQQQSPQTTPTKITLPNLVNLGILTPATSPAKNTQTLTFVQQQPLLTNTISNLTTANMLHQQKTHQGNASNNILLLESTQQLQQHSDQQHQLPLTPISPNSSPTAPVAVTATPTTAAIVQQKHVTNALLATLQQHRKQNIVGSIHLTSVGASVTNGNVNSGNNITSNGSSNGGGNNKSSVAVTVASSATNATATVAIVADAGAVVAAVSDET